MRPGWLLGALPFLALSAPPSCLLKQTDPSLLDPSPSSLPSLPQVSLLHRPEAGEKACIHPAFIIPALPLSRHCAKEPPWKEYSLSLLFPPPPLNSPELSRGRNYFPAHPPQDLLQGLLPGRLGTEPWAGTEQTSPSFLS